MSIVVRLEQNSLIIRSDHSSVGDADADLCLQAIEEYRSSDADSPKTIVLDFSIVSDVQTTAFDKLTVAARALSSLGVSLLVLAHKNFADSVRKKGIEEVFQCFVQAHAELEVPVTVPQSGPGFGGKPDTRELLEILLDSVTKTLKLTAAVACSPGNPLIRNESEAIHALKLDIAATIGLVSKPFKGTITLAFPSDSYLNLMSKILGTKCTDISRPEVRDWVAELLNISLGQAKTSLNRRAYEIQSAIPTVARGNDLEILHSQGKPSLVIPFTSDIGTFYFELSNMPTPTLVSTA